MLPAQPNQSLIDGLACLQQLASQREAVGGRELARQLDLEPTRVNRLLRTLAHLGLAQQDGSRKYRTGPGIHVLAAQAMFGSGLLRRAMPVLEQLREYKLTVALGVLWRDRVVYLYHASPRTPPGEALGRVGLYPSHQSGIGVAILAGHTNDELHAIYPDTSIRNKALAAARAARKQGYALVERDPGEATIAVRLAASDGAAIGLAGNLDAHNIDDLAGCLRDAAARIDKQGVPA